jgi:hypothetical protein
LIGLSATNRTQVFDPRPHLIAVGSPFVAFVTFCKTSSLSSVLDQTLSDEPDAGFNPRPHLIAIGYPSLPSLPPVKNLLSLLCLIGLSATNRTQL